MDFYNNESQANTYGLMKNYTNSGPESVQNIL